MGKALRCVGVDLLRPSPYDLPRKELLDCDDLLLGSFVVGTSSSHPGMDVDGVGGKALGDAAVRCADPLLRLHDLSIFLISVVR